MKCRNCKFVLDKDVEVCPNCGKSITEEPAVKNDDIELPLTKEQTGKLKPVKEEIPEEVVEEPTIKVEEPGEVPRGSDVPGEMVGSSVAGEIVKEEENKEKKEKISIEMTEEDQFVTNFIKKDDALKKMAEEPEKGNSSMMIARIAALLSVLFFAGVFYYTKVIAPKTQQKNPGDSSELIDDYNQTTNYTNTHTTGKILLDAEFGDETIITQLKKYNYDYDKDMSTVDITLDYKTLQGGQTFKVVLARSLSSSGYQDDVSFLYQEAKVQGIIRSYNSYNEDLITNMINSYVANEFDGGVVLYTKASTFQLGNPTTILIIKDGRFYKIEKVVTTYSLDGVSITQCPITFTGNKINYCQIPGEFKKGENVEIRKNTQVIGEDEKIIETLNAMIAK